MGGGDGVRICGEVVRGGRGLRGWQGKGEMGLEKRERDREEGLQAFQKAAFNLSINTLVSHNTLISLSIYLSFYLSI